MSIENGARFVRMLRQDPALRERVRAGGEQAFEEISAAAGASCTAFEVAAAMLRDMDAADSPAEREKLVLVGLVEPKSDDLVGAFKDWYLGNHVEDTYNCPNIRAVRCFRAEKGFLGEPPSGYLTIYEFEGDDAAAAEQALGRYQSDPDAWPQRKPNNGSMSIVGAGWYKQVVSFGS
jgi:hypothetical protein